VVVGVLALQGDVAAHAAILRGLGAEVREVRTAVDLRDLDGLVIPGGESTVMTLGLAREGLAEPLRALAAGGTPVLGTCAGMIVLDCDHLGVLPVRARRNAFGRQVRSFETELEVAGVPGPPVRAVFIRAPWIESWGDGVRVLACIDGHPVAVRQGDVLAVAFHPELAGETRVHALFLDAVCARAAGVAERGAAPRRSVGAGIGQAPGCPQAPAQPPSR
jgi:5'-phosphate synthase pdxT subunit